MGHLHPVTGTLASLALLALLSWAGPAQAEEGTGVGLGPVFAMDSEYGFWAGWELAGSTRTVFTRAALGGVYRIARGDAAVDSSGMHHHVAWEPWLLLGLTLGAGLDQHGEVRFNYGFWEGIPITVQGPGLIYEYEGEDRGMSWVVTLTLGWRDLGRSNQFYFAPKLWYVDPYTIDLHS